MFGLLKKKNPYAQQARGVYGAVLAHIRNPVFYERYKVPDSFDGRFDLMLVHVFMILHVSGDETFNQALFDVTFYDMDQTLREMGVGDVGVPKHMRKMMKAFNGRMHVYEDALEGGTLEEALKRNLYGTAEKPLAKDVKAFAAYMKKNLKALQKGGFDYILDDGELFKV